MYPGYGGTNFTKVHRNTGTRGKEEIRYAGTEGYGARRLKGTQVRSYTGYSGTRGTEVQRWYTGTEVRRYAGTRGTRGTEVHGSLVPRLFSGRPYTGHRERSSELIRSRVPSLG